MHIYSLANRTAPNEAGHVDHVGYRIAVSGNWGYVSDTYDRIDIINLQNPAQPVWVNIITGLDGTDGFVRDITAVNNKLYVADGFNLKVIDVSSPMSPRFSTEYPFTALLSRLHIQNNQLFISFLDSKAMTVVDTSRITNLQATAVMNLYQNEPSQ